MFTTSNSPGKKKERKSTCELHELMLLLSLFRKDKKVKHHHHLKRHPDAQPGGDGGRVDHQSSVLNHFSAFLNFNLLRLLLETCLLFEERASITNYFHGIFFINLLSKQSLFLNF
jgi:hypothetical protein